jgi:hypothetical protein
MSEVFMEAGYDVKKSEVPWNGDEGGIVTSHFRFGKKFIRLSSKRERLISSSLLNSWKAFVGSIISDVTERSL